MILMFTGSQGKKDALSGRSVNVVFIQSDFTFEFLIGLKTLTTSEDSDFVNKLCKYKMRFCLIIYSTEHIPSERSKRHLLAFDETDNPWRSK